MRSQIFVSFAVVALSSVAHASETEYLGLYMRGVKVGYSSYISSAARFRGVSATKTVSITDISLGLLGTQTEVRITDTTFTDKSGRPIQMKFDQSSRGRTQHVIADLSLIHI